MRTGRKSRLILSAGFAFSAMCGPAEPQGFQPVAIELALAVDCSYSVNDHEYALQMEGIAAAFRDPEVMELIEALPDGIAVALFHWAGTTNNAEAVPWRRLKDRPSVLGFAREVEAARRSRLGYYTSIGHAIDYGVMLLETNAFLGRQRKIDISGDGHNNAGPDPAEVRYRALARGITINGLAVLGNDPGLANYYAMNVVVGPGAFVISAESYGDFAVAMKRKLLRELGPQVAALP